MSAGLTIGLAIGILILLWVQDELSYDTYHAKADNIYRMELWGGTGSSRQIWQMGPGAIAPMVKQQLPEVEDQTRISGNYLFTRYKYQEKSFGDESVVFADPSFFNIFTVPFIQGDNRKPFGDQNTVVVTKSTAQKFFGDENAIGKVITADNTNYFTVTGVINDFPKNSSFQFDMIMPMAYNAKFMRDNHIDIANDFTFFNYEMYLLLKPGTSLKDLSKKVFNIHIAHKSDDTDAEYIFEPLTKMHLYAADGSDRGAGTVHIFIVIAILILVIACINYVNLSTARSMLRAKEISMRKIVGAAKMQLFLQFVVETAVLFSISALLALGLVFVLTPVFNDLSGKQLTVNLTDIHIWEVLLAAIAGTLVISSIYPALLLSSFEPLKALKGKISAGIGDALFRKILVVTQFSFSIVLIIGTIVITSQLGYIRSKNLGYDKTHVFAFNMGKMRGHYEAAKAELLKQSGVLAVTCANQNIVQIGGITGNTDWEGKLPNQTFIVHPMAIDKDFLSFFKMKMADGAPFTGSGTDTAHLVLNETAIKQLGMKNPVGKRFKMSQVNGTILGVVKDFHFASMREQIAPAAFFYEPKWFNIVYVKTTGRDAQKAIAAAEAQFKYYNGDFPFKYDFLDDTFNKLYQGEQREGVIFNYFAGIAIIISCLGLLGLATYTAQVRTREIGVRKVLGASVSSITTMLSMDFVKLVFWAIVISSPVAWYAMRNWLQGFAYRIDIQWWVFVAAGSSAIIIALLTISFQAIKAALMNPVKSLRSE